VQRWGSAAATVGPQQRPGGRERATEQEAQVVWSALRRSRGQGKRAAEQLSAKGKRAIEQWGRGDERDF